MTTPAPRPRAVSGGVLFRLVQCRRRLWLDAHEPAPPVPPDDHDALLRRRGLELEARVAASLPGLAGPFVRPGVPFEQAVRQTRAAMAGRRPLAHAALPSAAGTPPGTPDFLIPTDDGWIVRDAKLSLHPAPREDARLQLEHYASPFESSNRASRSTV